MTSTPSSPGSKGWAKWSQTQCQQCNAWLKPVPDYCRHLADDAEMSIWTYSFVCVACGHEHERLTTTPPDWWITDPDAEIHEPGSRPPAPVRDPELWTNADQLTDVEKDLTAGR